MLSIDSAQNKLSDEIMLLGLFDIPLFQRASDVTKYGLEMLKTNPDVKRWLIKAARPIAQSLLTKIPGLDLIAPQIVDAIADKVQQS